MKKNKFTSMVAVISSIALVGSMVSLPAYAMESNDENTALVSQIDEATTTSEDTTTETTTNDENSTPAADADVSTSSAATEQNTTTTTEDNHDHDDEDREPEGYIAPSSDPIDIHTGLQGITRASASTFADSSSVDPSDLSKWVVFDHYDANTGSATKPTDWDTTVNSDGLHPWFYQNEASYAGQHPGKFYDLSGVGSTIDKQNYITEVLQTKKSGYYSIARTNQHIFTMGDQNNGEMYFTGYGLEGYLDFALTKTPNTDTSLKSIAFDIDAAAINPHSAASFGFFVNAGVDGDTFKGQAVDFGLSGTVESNNIKIQPRIKDMSSGVDNMSTVMHTTNGYLDTVGGTNYGSPIALNAGTGVFHLDIQVDNDKNELSVEITPYSAPNVLDQSKKQTFTAPLAQTGYQAFGPYIQYQRHGCSKLSYIKFGNMQLSSNLDVYFWSNPNNGDKGSNFAVVNGIEKGTTINTTAGETMPSAPTQQGKSFKGWNTQADGNGEWFTGDTTVLNTTNVYAIWGENGINVNYNPTVWTRDSVTATITIASLYKPEKVIVTFPDGSTEEVAVTQSSTNASEFIGQLVTEKNIVGGKVTATVSDGQGGFQDLSETIDITWIDKAAPTVTNLPTGDANKVLTFADMGSVTFTDNGSENAALNGAKESGVNDNSRKVYFFQNGSIVKETTWADLEETMKNLPTGKYGYAVSVEDNVKNYGDSNGKSGEAATNVPTPDAPTVPEVIINPVAPRISPALTFKDGSGAYSDGTWTNKDVTVDYKVTDDFLNLTEVKENADSVLVTEDLNFDKDFDLTKNGQYSYTINAKNQAGLAADPKTVTVKIDKDAPEITLPAKNSVFAESAFGTSDVLSGVDTSKTKLVAVPYVNGKLSTDPSAAITINDITSSNWSNGKLTEGSVYQFTLSSTDIAGNSASKTVDNVQYIVDPDAATKKEIDVWAVKSDSNTYNIYVESKTYSIEQITMSIAGGSTQVIPTNAGYKNADFQITAPYGKDITFTTRLASGAVITSTFNPSVNGTEIKTSESSYVSPVHPAAPATVKAISSNLSTNNASAISGSAFQNAVKEGFELDGKQLTNPPVRYMARRSGLGNYVTYANPTMIFNLARNNEYEIILVVTDTATKTVYYVDGSSAGSTTTAPTSASAGYKVKGV